MNAKRFETLAETYGGDVARWPAGERESAAALMAGDPVWAAAVLAEAAALDDLLATSPAILASASLTDRIVTGAPRVRGSRGWAGWLLPAGMGAGLAAACAAGVMLGSQLSAPVASAPDNTADGVVAAVGDDDVSLYLDEEA